MTAWQPPTVPPPAEGPLVDSFGRIADDLRVSVTDRCNFRCTYCMPAEGLAWLPKSEILTFEESTRLLEHLRGARRPVDQGDRRRADRARGPARRSSGCSARSDPSSTSPSPRTACSSTGSPVRSPRPGVDRATVSCDSLMRHRFAEMTRRDALDKVFAGLKAAEDAGLTPIKINTVVIGGTNDDEVVEFARWSRETGYEVRFIEYMPLDAEHAWERAKVVPSARILETIATAFPLSPIGHANEPATSYAIRRRRSGADRRHRERDRAVLRHVQPPPADGRGPGARVPVLAGGDGPARTHARRRHGRRARGADPRPPCGGSGRVTASTTPTSCSRRAACR